MAEFGGAGGGSLPRDLSLNHFTVQARRTSIASHDAAVDTPGLGVDTSTSNFLRLLVRSTRISTSVGHTSRLPSPRSRFVRDTGRVRVGLVPNGRGAISVRRLRKLRLCDEDR